MCFHYTFRLVKIPEKSRIKKRGYSNWIDTGLFGGIERKMKQKKTKETDMTQGVIWKQLLLFALPLMVGNVFQQLYNTVDSIVVGNFVGKEALAAVGSVGPIINSLIGFFMGLATGAGVVISQAYGARNDAQVSKAVHTTFLMTFGLCVIFTVVGILMTPAMLRLMGTPSDVYRQAEDYLKIYFAGVSGLMVYNMGSGVLRAVGDSRRPLYFLIFSACVNTVLDVVFVAGLNMGIAGAALATVIAQVLSAILILVVLARSQGACQFRFSRLRLDIPSLTGIVRIGMPAAIQMTITSVSNVFVQSYINSFGSAVMAGWSAYNKIDQFLMLPMQSVALAATTFVGQNYGAGNLSRVKKGTGTAMKLAMIVTGTLMIPVLLLARYLVGLFSTEAEVIGYGSMLLRMISPFYLVCCINQICASSLRGLGNSQAPMVIMLGSFVVFRQIYLFIVSRTFSTIRAVALGYPAGWIVCSVILLFYYRMYWKKRAAAAKIT